jgi:short-subunit dehydrogenase/uncharacterized protein YndB with AHSA1/START domain
MPASPPPAYLVTGASSGIGMATALTLADRGSRLVLFARSGPALDAVRSRCEARGARAVVVTGDVRDQRAVESAFVTAQERFGGLDGVVHAAGVASYGPIEHLPAEVFDATVNTTLLGTANVARATVSHFRARGAGRLVVLGSILGSVAVPYMAAYTASKWGVHGLVRSLQLETRSDPIDITLVMPGSVDTPIFGNAATYLRRHGAPPPPVHTPQHVVDVIISALDHPHRAVDAGWANKLIRVVFRRVPSVYDAAVTPVMHRFGLGTATSAAFPGNVFEPLSTARMTSDPPENTMSTTNPRATISRDVAAPAEAVWQVLCDGWTYATWVVGASRVRDVDPDWPAVGSRIHHAFGPWPAVIEDYTRVESATPDRSLILTARGWPIGEARVAIRIEPEGAERCTVSIREDAVAGPGSRLPLPVRQMVIAPRNKETVYRLALIAEGRHRNAQRLNRAAADPTPS